MKFWFLRQHNKVIDKMAEGVSLNLYDKAIAFSFAMWQWSKEKFQPVTNCNRLKRLETCNQHPECYTKLHFCIHCGCWIPLKSMIPSSTCAKGYWPLLKQSHPQSLSEPSE